METETTTISPAPESTRTAELLAQSGEQLRIRSALATVKSKLLAAQAEQARTEAEMLQLLAVYQDTTRTSEAALAAMLEEVAALEAQQAS